MSYPTSLSGDIAVFDPTFADGKDKIRGIASKTIHNYFFLKALDAVKDGGIVTFITSQGVMDSRNMAVRGEMMVNADLLSAIRLPSNLFTDNANTEVGSDLIILQKHEGKTGGTMDEAHFIAGLSDGENGLEINNYYKTTPRPYHPYRREKGYRPLRQTCHGLYAQRRRGGYRHGLVPDAVGGFVGTAGLGTLQRHQR